MRRFSTSTEQVRHLTPPSSTTLIGTIGYDSRIAPLRRVGVPAGSAPAFKRSWSGGTVSALGKAVLAALAGPPPAGERVAMVFSESEEAPQGREVPWQAHWDSVYTTALWHRSDARVGYFVRWLSDDPWVALVRPAR